jgi:Ca2+-binding RTX toxin-like protein
MPRSLVTPLRTALAAVVVIVGAALIAQAAEAAYTVEVRNQTLRITGNAASDRLALRVSPGAADTLQVDVRDDGSADFDGNGGDDVVDASALAANAIGLSANGGDGDDVLIGSAGPDTLLGAAGDDVLIGGPDLEILDGGPGDNIVIQD